MLSFLGKRVDRDVMRKMAAAESNLNVDHVLVVRNHSDGGLMRLEEISLIVFIIVGSSREWIDSSMKKLILKIWLPVVNSWSSPISGVGVNWVRAEISSGDASASSVCVLGVDEQTLSPDKGGVMQSLEEDEARTGSTTRVAIWILPEILRSNKLNPYETRAMQSEFLPSVFEKSSLLR
ncbi:hypothetical protein ACLB2K_060346 [Fragaria x ananassa]